jgi:hypothetical protein
LILAEDGAMRWVPYQLGGHRPFRAQSIRIASHIIAPGRREEGVCDPMPIEQIGAGTTLCKDKKVRRMFWLSLDCWNNILVGLLVASAAATAVVIRLQKQEAVDATRALDQYKITAKQESDTAIGLAIRSGR